MISTPLSCNQKKSSINKDSPSSSSLTIGTNIGSGIKEKDNIIPEIMLPPIARNMKNPKRELISWKVTIKKEKYLTKLATVTL